MGPERKGRIGDVQWPALIHERSIHRSKPMEDFLELYIKIAQLVIMLIIK